MFKPSLTYVLLFVKNPQESAQFYSNLLGLKPVEQSATFALFVLPNGIKLGLWSRFTAEPRVEASPGCTEICFPVEDVDACFQDWSNKTITIIQKPTDMDFGRTFVALDSDGHRIRIFKLHENQ